MDTYAIYNVNAPDFEKKAKDVAKYLKQLGRALSNPKASEKDWKDVDTESKRLKDKYPDIDKE